MRGMAREYAAGNSLGPGWRESAGIFGCPVGGSPTVPSGREWNGSQPGQGAAELLSPRPAIRKMQGQPACRAGEPSGQGEEPPPEGLGGGYPLSQTDPRRPAGQVVGHRLDGQPGGVRLASCDVRKFFTRLTARVNAVRPLVIQDFLGSCFSPGNLLRAPPVRRWGRSASCGGKLSDLVVA